MSLQLLPLAFDDLVRQAVCVFWGNRSQGAERQQGSRGNVISGKNLNGFLQVVKAVAGHCGLPEEAVITTGRARLTIPGYYRPTKNWDALIVHQGRLLAAFEFKSQVGSFGNNFNNRSEEAIGNAADLWVAFQNGAYDPARSKFAAAHFGFEGQLFDDPRPPFVGYLVVLQDDEASRQKVAINSPHFDAFPEFKDTSYAQRYRLLCERLVEQKLYSAAALVMSEAASGLDSGEHHSLSAATSVRNLFAEFAGRVAAAMASG